jgi:hypothetical protein
VSGIVKVERPSGDGQGSKKFVEGLFPKRELGGEKGGLGGASKVSKLIVPE